MFDYGHMHSAPGDTLQAIRSHRYEHALTSPGEADVTAQVDFAQIADAFQGPRTAIDGPITQAEFLGRLGIIERASKLMSANPAKAGEIEAGVARLIAPTGMGSRFKVIGVRSSGLPTLPGF
jgi:NADH dehydrogenase [ubiquinone] 1 alpha subcomplex assembly factor 7